MPIHATCPTCGTSVMVPDDEAGQMRKCETCGEMVRVPREAPDAVLAALAEGEPVAAPEQTECPRCQRGVPADSLRCPWCGYDFSREEWPHAEPAVRPTGGPVPRDCPTYAWLQWLAGFYKVVGAVVAVLGCIGVLIVVAVWSSSSHGDAPFGFYLVVWLFSVSLGGFLLIGIGQVFEAFRHIAINVWTLTHRAVAPLPAAPDQK